MVTEIKKRDGRIEPFNKKKIESAISRANREVDTSDQISEVHLSGVLRDICLQCEFIEGTPSVEDIQEIVETQLMKHEAYEVAKTYIRYRYQHMLDRVRRADLMNKIGEKIRASNIENQNANVDEMSFGGRKGEADSALMKQWALDNCISKMARCNHENNEIYIHDLDSYAVGMHNCYNSDTAFITYDGVKRFKELSDGQKVKIVDQNGVWRDATVRKYGMQKMYDLTFSAGRTQKTVTCTRNHRWVLIDGSITDNIQVGDKLFLTQEMQADYAIDNKLWCLGFVIGDGCDRAMLSKDRQRITNGAMLVRLCGKKNKYIERFLDCGWSIGQRFENGDVILSSRGNGSYKQTFLNNEIWKIMSHKKKFIEYSSGVAGFYLLSQSIKENDTNFKTNRRLYEFKFIKKQSIHAPWKLESIRASRSGLNGQQTAWCVEEPITHTFTLDGGMVTGNCLSIPFDDLLAKGFTTRQTDVRPAQSVNTAFQLLAVLFQLQSLQQFGGVSATHLDWTMVPYVRKSFRKHFLDALKYVSKYDEARIERERSWIAEHPDSGIDDEHFSTPSDAYRYAMDMTVKETWQAVEGMYHNLK